MVIIKITTKNHSEGGNASIQDRGIHKTMVTMVSYNTLARDRGRRRLFEHMRNQGEQVETLWDQGRQSDT